MNLKPLVKNDLQEFTAKIVLEDGGDLSQVKVMLSVMNGPVNTPHNGTSPRGFWPQPIMLSAQENGMIEGAGFSPIEYYCIIDAPGYLRHTQRVKFQRNQTLDVGSITLEKPRQIKLSYIVAQQPPFDLEKTQTATISAGTRWKAVEDIYGWDLEFKQKDGDIILDYSYGPCQLWDLGEGQLEDCVDIKRQSEGIRPHRYPAADGHVYLVNQGHWKRWILLKIGAGK